MSDSRVCPVCDAKLPEPSRVDRLYCSARCRQRRHVAGRRGALRAANRVRWQAAKDDVLADHVTASI